jgi:alcohol dehydrogenase YqhD (iron-dependent ADH family)
MNNFTFFSPTCFEFGRDTESRTGALVKRFGGSKVLIHYGSGSVIRSGLMNRVQSSLQASGLDCVLLGGVQPNPRSGLVYEGIEICRREGVDFVLAIGGGSTIDSAKAIAAGVPHMGDFWEFFSGKAVIGKAIPVGVVLTLAAAGSEGSGVSVITREQDSLKRATYSDLIKPVFAIMNPALTCTLPPYQTACGAMDIMAHVMERYFTNTPDVELTDRLCEAVLTTIIEQVPRVLSHPDDYNARANIMWAGMLAHNDICGAGRDQDWASHKIEHELSALYDVAHGAGLAVIFPAWMKYVLEHNPMRFARFAVKVWGCDMDYMNPLRTAREGISRLEAFITSIGLPLNFAGIGAREADIEYMVRTSGVNENFKLGSYVSLGAADVAAIYRLAL